ncbi:MAG TPA: hypothetical protein VGC95_08670, partial [Chitinophagaceae bacterium]
HNLHALCDDIAAKDDDFHVIIREFGYPPLWTRSASFETLVHIILEQQVSLASARAALEKLRERIGAITPEKVLQLSAEELKACFFSRQKALYAQELARALVGGMLNLEGLSTAPEELVRKELTAIKGIGNWTADVYLIFVLRRADIFPVGDLAMVNALKEVKRLPAATSRDTLVSIAESWRPLRSIATMLLWHYYIRKRGISFPVPQPSGGSAPA